MSECALFQTTLFWIVGYLLELNGATTVSIMTLRRMTFSIMTFSMMTFSMPLSITIFSKKTLSIMTFRIKTIGKAIRKYDIQHNNML